MKKFVLQMHLLVKPQIKDWDTEYLDKIISVKVVDGIDDAIKHISKHSSHHTESIVTNNTITCEKFF